MKGTVSFGLFLAWTLAASAQGTIEFTAYLHGTNVVPPSLTPYDGHGRFSLNNSTLSYEVQTLYLVGWTGAVYGAASPGNNAPALFGLTLVVARAPFPPDDLGANIYRGAVTVTSEQVSELTAGFWYVQISSAPFSDRAMRGQIELVPEPSVLWLLSVCFTVFLVQRFYRRPAVYS